MGGTLPAASTPLKRGRSFAPILLAIVVGVAAFIWLNRLNPPYAVTDDGVRDQLLARDCIDLGRCHLMGPATSVAGFQQGAVWLDLVIAVRMLGGDVAMQRTVVIALLAVGVATLFVVVWRWLRPSLALPAAVLLLGALSFDVSTNLLVNSSAAPFPDVLCAAGLLCFALSGRLRFLVAAAFALGLAINVHIASLIVVASLVALAALASPHPWRALVTSASVLLATYYFTSSAALRANIMGLAAHGRFLPVLALGLVVTVVCVRLGRHFRRLPWESRAWLAGLILILPYALATVWLVFAQRHHFGVVYFHAVLTPAAAFGAALICVPFEFMARRFGALRWIPTAASLGALAFAATHLDLDVLLDRVQMSAWSLSDATAVSEVAVRHGWSYEDLILHLQGTWCRDLLIGMSVVAPAPESDGGRDSRQLQVVKMRRDALLPGEREGAIVLGPNTVAVAREIESWLRPDRLRACRVRVGSALPAVCADATPRAKGISARERFLFVSRSYPESHNLDVPPPYIATYEIPLAPIAGESRELSLSEPGLPDCVWQFTRAEGVRVEGELPSRRVRLRSDDGRAALLVIEKPFGTSACEPLDLDRRYPPCLLETAPGDPMQTREGIF